MRAVRSNSGSKLMQCPQRCQQELHSASQHRKYGHNVTRQDLSKGPEENHPPEISCRKKEIAQVMSAQTDLVEHHDKPMVLGLHHCPPKLVCTSATWEIRHGEGGGQPAQSAALVYNLSTPCLSQALLQEVDQGPS